MKKLPHNLPPADARTGTDRIGRFITLREHVRLQKQAGLPKPWTDDPILSQYRFCNIHREDDFQTLWIAQHWRGPNAGDPDIWFAMTVARLVNWHETLEEIGYPVPFKPLRFIKALQGRRERGEKAFSGAYIVSTNGHRMDKAEYLVEHVLAPLWRDRKKLALSVVNWRCTYSQSLEDIHTLLSRYNGLGSFMAAQVVADIRYVPMLHTEAADWWTFAASGPGSRRGLNRLMGYEVGSPWREVDWQRNAEGARGDVNKWLRTYNTGIKLHGQDFQNCLCEFDKYERTRLGEGRPRSKYDGGFVQPELL
jgi:hypothetical protein